MRYWAYHEDVLTELLEFEPSIMQDELIKDREYLIVTFDTGSPKAIYIPTFKYYDFTWVNDNMPEVLV